jgi:ABC-type Mn2+/Zn2+ transport system ATPase subunit
MSAISYYEDLIRYLNQLKQDLVSLIMNAKECSSINSSIDQILTLAKKQIVEIESNES